MPRARKHLICLSETPYYHITSRCVRRAFLCGFDQLSGRSYEHRRAWIEDRIRVLSSIFNVEICAYAIMSNHYHLVVRLRSHKGCDWSDDDVLSRWTSLFRGPLLVQQHCSGQQLSPPELATVRAAAAAYRARLHSLSWFMKCLNEPIARQANAEDGCTGHFWEARFHSQPLRSEAALFSAMAYVDLNPVRAGIAETPEDSAFTSIKARLHKEGCKTTGLDAATRLLERNELKHFSVPPRPLANFACRTPGAPTTNDPLPMYERDYLLLVDLTGRIASSGKRGRIEPALAPILDRLGLTPTEWVQAATNFRQHYRNGDLRLKKSA